MVKWHTKYFYYRTSFVNFRLFLMSKQSFMLYNTLEREREREGGREREREGEREQKWAKIPFPS